MEPLLQQSQRPLVLEFCEQLAQKGLRTLVFAQKLLSQEESDKLVENYKSELKSPEGSEGRVQKILSEIEKDLNFLCVTGVRETLQDGVADTVKSL